MEFVRRNFCFFITFVWLAFFTLFFLVVHSFYTSKVLCVDIVHLKFIFRPKRSFQFVRRWHNINLESRIDKKRSDCGTYTKVRRRGRERESICRTGWTWGAFCIARKLMLSLIIIFIVCFVLFYSFFFSCSRQVLIRFCHSPIGSVELFDR